jgi:hypothetical protein
LRLHYTMNLARLVTAWSMQVFTGKVLFYAVVFASLLLVDAVQAALTTKKCRYGEY